MECQDSQVEILNCHLKQKNAAIVLLVLTQFHVTELPFINL